MSPADIADHEHAARAAGLRLVWKRGVCKGGPFCAPFVASTGAPWRPLEDDGDALRLAVALAARTESAVLIGVNASVAGCTLPAARASIFADAVKVGRHLEPAPGGSRQPTFI